MKHTANIFTSHIAFALTLFLTSLGSAHVIAQSVGLSSKPLLRSTLSDDNSKETTILTVEFAPGVRLVVTYIMEMNTLSLFKALWS
ncbi:MAG: hypothetical protein V9E91_03835 [Burkholderiaceae bacterium]